MVKVLCSGSRHWVRPVHNAREYSAKLAEFNTRVGVVLETLTLFRGRMGVTPGNIQVIHGAAKGVDSLVDAEAKRLGFSIRAYPADWSIGVGAGPIRNRKMLDENPDIERVLAFSDDIYTSQGTLHMARYAHGRGYTVEVYKTDGSSELFFDRGSRNSVLFGARRYS